MRKWKRFLLAAMTAAFAAGACLTSAAADAIGPGFETAAEELPDVQIYVSMLYHTLTLTENGQVIGVYDAEVGRQSEVDDKVKEGDQRTPIGEFYVCTRNEWSRYYLGLGVSYPNIEDAERGYAAGLISAEERDAIIDAITNKQQPPWDTALGGVIEIHGDRTPGTGTAGCIAVDNSVMDILWEKCPIGVPITIGP